MVGLEAIVPVVHDVVEEVDDGAGVGCLGGKLGVVGLASGVDLKDCPTYHDAGEGTQV